MVPFPLKFKKMNVGLLKERKKELSCTYSTLGAAVGLPPDRLCMLFNNDPDGYLTAEELKRFLTLLGLKEEQVLEGADLQSYRNELQRAYQWHKATFAPQQEI